MLGIAKELIKAGQGERGSIKPSLCDHLTNLIRLQIELVNISMEKKIRAVGNQQEITILNRLIKCEGSSWASI
jgi:hypothetical protein